MTICTKLKRTLKNGYLVTSEKHEDKIYIDDKLTFVDSYWIFVENPKGEVVNHYKTAKTTWRRKHNDIVRDL